jgi:hypothetical protein
MPSCPAWQTLSDYADSNAWAADPNGELCRSPTVCFKPLPSGFSTIPRYNAYTCHPIQPAVQMAAVPNYRGSFAVPYSSQESPEAVGGGSCSCSTGRQVPFGMSLQNACCSNYETAAAAAGTAIGIGGIAGAIAVAAGVTAGVAGAKGLQSQCSLQGIDRDTGASAMVCDKDCGNCDDPGSNRDSACNTERGRCAARCGFKPPSVTNKVVLGTLSYADSCPALGPGPNPVATDPNSCCWWNGTPTYQASSADAAQGIVWCAYSAHTVLDGMQVGQSPGHLRSKGKTPPPSDSVRALLHRCVFRLVCDRFVDEAFNGGDNFLDYFDEDARRLLVTSVVDRSNFANALGPSDHADDIPALKTALPSFLTLPQFDYVSGEGHYVYLPVYTALFLQLVGAPKDALLVPGSPRGHPSREQLNQALQLFLRDRNVGSRVHTAAVSFDDDPACLAKDDNYENEFVMYVTIEDAGGGRLTFTPHNTDLTVYFSGSAARPSRRPRDDGFVRTFVLGRVYKCKVKTWSATLAAIFSHWKKLHPEELCVALAKGNCNCTPVECFEARCLETSGQMSNECKQGLRRDCADDNDLSLRTDFPGAAFHLSEHFVQRGSDACRCQISLLPPVLDQANQQEAGRCFTTACVDKTRLIEAYGLQDDRCTQHCDTVRSWFETKDPAGKSQMPSYLNKGRFERLCGPLLPSPFNVVAFFAAAAVSVGLLLLSAQARLVTNKLLLVAGLVLVSVSAFLGFFLKGAPSCGARKERVCNSQLTGTPLPLLFCPSPVPCECSFDSDCPNAERDKCVSGECHKSEKSCLRPSPPQDWRCSAFPGYQGFCTSPSASGRAPACVDPNRASFFDLTPGASGCAADHEQYDSAGKPYCWRPANAT